MKRKIWAMFLVIFVFSMITFVFFGCGEKNPYPNRQHKITTRAKPLNG